MLCIVSWGWNLDIIFYQLFLNRKVIENSFEIN